MGDAQRVDESAMRRLCEAGDHAGAAALAVHGYGSEVYGFLVAIHHDEENAGEVFSVFAEDLLRGLPGFRWQCTLRTWAYALARNASHRFLKDAARRRRGVPLSQVSAISALAAEVRTRTAQWLRTETKNRVAQLRESLPPEDQTLLILRVDRDLGWEEIARAFLPDPEGCTGEQLTREAARLRKRFQLVKQRLTARAKREGLLS